MENNELVSVNYNKTLIVSGFPEQHNENLIFDVCDCYGKVEKVELEYEAGSKKFNGTAKVEFASEFEA